MGLAVLSVSVAVVLAECIRSGLARADAGRAFTTSFTYDDVFARRPAVAGFRSAIDDDPPTEKDDDLESYDRRTGTSSALKSPRDDVYPSLTTAVSHLPPVDGDKQVENEYATDSLRDGTAAQGDQRPEWSTIDANSAPCWNGYHSGNRLLTRVHHGPVFVDLSDGGADHSGPTGSGRYGWYGEIKRPAVARRPVGSGGGGALLTAALVTLAKLKVFKAVKTLVLSAVALKLFAVFALFKTLLFVKLLAAVNAAKMLLVPLLPGIWSGLAYAAASVLNYYRKTTAACSSFVAESSESNGTAATDAVAARADPPSFVARLSRLIASVRSARCVPSKACRAVHAASPNYASAWLNGALLSLIDYIPHKKLKLYKTTFKEVLDNRLENVSNNISTEEWLKWCDKHYQCNKKTMVNNNN